MTQDSTVFSTPSIYRKLLYSVLLFCFYFFLNHWRKKAISMNNCYGAIRIVAQYDFFVWLFHFSNKRKIQLFLLSVDSITREFCLRGERTTSSLDSINRNNFPYIHVYESTFCIGGTLINSDEVIHLWN